MSDDELLKLVTVLQAELEATNRQVEILSDALAESRREVEALKAQPAPVLWLVDGKVEASDLPEDYTGCLYTTPPAQPAPVQPVTQAIIHAITEYGDARADQDANNAPTTSHQRLADCIRLIRDAITPPAAQPAPVQEPAATVQSLHVDGKDVGVQAHLHKYLPVGTKLYTNPPAAQRQWVGLTDEDREILEAVRREMDEDDDGNAPGHGHRIPGIWDEDNGDLAGKPCAWCLTWAKFTALIERENNGGAA